MTEVSRAFAGEHGAMNNWDKIWKKRTAKIENRATVFEMFKELKRADGFDTQGWRHRLCSRIKLQIRWMC